MNILELIIIVLLVIVIILLCILINKDNNKNTNKEEVKKTLDIKNIVEKKEFGEKDSENSIFNNIEPGDIVYCIMPMSKAELAKVPEGHKERPYLIVDKGKDFLYGYYSTTHINENIPYQQRYTYRRNFTNKNNEIVDANFVLDQVYKIPKDNIFDILDNLDEYEKQEVARRLAIKNLKGFPKIKKKNLKLKVGDVVTSDAKWYFISDIDKTGIYGYLAYPPNHGTKKGIRVSRKYGPSYYNFKEKVKLENVSINELLFISSPTETNNVLKAAEDYKRNMKYKRKKANQRAAKIKKAELISEDSNENVIND